METAQFESELKYIGDLLSAIIDDIEKYLDCNESFSIEYFESIKDAAHTALSKVVLIENSIDMRK